MECPICLSSIENNFIQVSCCNKIFHTECFIKCMDLKKNCPMCRATFSSEPPSDQVVIEIMEEQQNVMYYTFKWVSCIFFITLVSILCVLTYERTHLN